MTDTDEKLKPCPHGSKARLCDDIDMSGKGEFWVQAESGWMGPIKSQPDDAVIAWNDRTNGTVDIKEAARTLNALLDKKVGDFTPGEIDKLWKTIHGREGFTAVRMFLNMLSSQQPEPTTPVNKAARLILDELMNAEEHDAWEAAQDVMDKGGMASAADVVIAALRSLAGDDR